MITGWQLWHPAGQSHAELVMIDVATGKRQVLLSAPEYNFSGPRVSPDGRFIVCQRETQSTPERPPDLTLVLLGVNGAGAAGEAGPRPAARPGQVARRARLVARFPDRVLRRR